MDFLELYQKGILENVVNQMDLKELTKAAKSQCIRFPSKNLVKLREQFLFTIERDMKKGSAFMRTGF